METKNNTGLVVAVTILAMLVLGLLGFIVYDKVLRKENPANNDTTYEDYDLDDAKELVDKYFVTTAFGTSFEKFDENTKVAIAVANVRQSDFESVDCDLLYKNANNVELFENGDYFVEELGVCHDETTAVSYNLVNTTYQSLFGTNGSAKKDDYVFGVSEKVDYHEDTKSFVFLAFQGGQDSYPIFSYNVESAKIYNNDKLVVVVKQKTYNEDENTTEYQSFELEFDKEDNNKYILKNIIEK